MHFSVTTEMWSYLTTFKGNFNVRFVVRAPLGHWCNCTPYVWPETFHIINKIDNTFWLTVETLLYGILFLTVVALEGFTSYKEVFTQVAGSNTSVTAQCITRSRGFRGLGWFKCGVYQHISYNFRLSERGKDTIRGNNFVHLWVKSKEVFKFVEYWGDLRQMRVIFSN